jgi:hypothetical protein
MKTEYVHTFPHDFHCESQNQTMGFAMLCSFTFDINIPNEKYRKTQKLLTLVKRNIVFPVPTIKEFKGGGGGGGRDRSTHFEPWH